MEKKLASRNMFSSILVFVILCSSTFLTGTGSRFQTRLNSTFQLSPAQNRQTILDRTLIFSPPERMRTGYRLLVGGGGSNPYPRSGRALQFPLLSMRERPTQKILRDIQKGLRITLQTRNEFTLVLHGTGMTGMSAVLDNMIQPGDKVLVGVYGHWGLVASEVIQRLGGDLVTIQKPLGQRLTLQEIETGIVQHSPKILFLVNGESSTGVYQPLDGIGDLCHKYNCITVVDVVATVGQQPVKMDENKIDVVYMNSQKGLGGIVGLAPVSFSPRAMGLVRNRTTRPRMAQLDIIEQSKAWYLDPSFPDGYPLHSISLPLLCMLREALAVIVEEGIENVWKRHADTAQYLVDGGSALGLKLYPANPQDRLIGTTTFEVPSGKDAVKIEGFVFDNYLTEISLGMGPTAGKLIRVGTFGNNARRNVVEIVLHVLRNALNSDATNSLAINGTFPFLPKAS